jgi:hypothetical protein
MLLGEQEMTISVKCCSDHLTVFVSFCRVVGAGKAILFLWAQIHLHIRSSLFCDFYATKAGSYRHFSKIYRSDLRHCGMYDLWQLYRELCGQ